MRLLTGRGSVGARAGVLYGFQSGEVSRRASRRFIGSDHRKVLGESSPPMSLVECILLATSRSRGLGFMAGEMAARASFDVAKFKALNDEFLGLRTWK